MKNLIVLYTLIRLLSFKEVVTILIHHFFKRDLHLKNIHLHRILIFVINCLNKKYLLRKKGKEHIEVILSNFSSLKITLRKYTRDVLVFHQVFIQLDYEPFVKMIKAEKHSIKFIIDAGANIGCASLFFKSYFPDAAIRCIEPEQTNFDLLKLNTSSNHLTNTTLLRKALWNTHTTLELNNREDSVDAFHVMQSGEISKIIDTVETCTINDLFEQNEKVQRIDLFKIDIEGAEKILFEDTDCLHSFLPYTRYIAVEVHEEFISESKVIGILNQFGYEVSKNGEYLIAKNKNLIG